MALIAVKFEEWDYGARPWRVRVDGLLLRDARRRTRCFGSRQAAQTAGQVAVRLEMVSRASRGFGWAGAAYVSTTLPRALRDLICASPSAPWALLSRAQMPGCAGCDAHIIVALDGLEERGISRVRGTVVLNEMWAHGKFLRRRAPRHSVITVNSKEHA